ncbi:MAG: PHP domain-containing protein [Candidatus Omnitrophica bacterium]|nr:PHP domain-containing protein [Candidatus Omnitrophota bacterium]
MEKADLHIHSAYSDGSLSIEDIFKQSREKGLRCIAITDHDTVEGALEAEGLTELFGVEFIKGIELSAEYDKTDVHILGYFVDTYNKNLLNELKDMKQFRRERLISMAKKVNSLGGRVDIDELVCQINQKVATRLHLALYMLEKKQVNSVWEAFKKYLSADKSAYVRKSSFSVREAITLIKQADGLAVLAHPHFLPSNGWFKKFVHWGLDGMEVIYPGFSPRVISYYTRLADSLGLFKSGGSDSHGTHKQSTPIGKITIPYSWVETMKDAKRPLLYKENL